MLKKFYHHALNQPEEIKLENFKIDELQAN